MSTRAQRKAKANFWLRCRGCGAYRVRHFEPWTKTYICQPRPERPEVTPEEARRMFLDALRGTNPSPEVLAVVEQIENEESA